MVPSTGHFLQEFDTTVSLRDRAEAARAMLKHCTICELRCGVDRTRREPCPCLLGSDTYVYKKYVSLHEGPDLAPAFRVFFGGCNFRCCFCDEAPHCFRTNHGEPVEPKEFAAELEQATQRGVNSISLLGGEPLLHVHTILATVAASVHRPTLVLNTNMYMTPEVLDLLDGVVHLYLADFKFGCDGCADRLAHIPRYSEVVRRNLIRAASKSPVIVRHLLIPGHFECCFRPIVDWMAENLPDVRFQLYTSYVPCWRASSDSNIGRLNTRVEARRAAAYVEAAHLRQEAVVAGSAQGRSRPRTAIAGHASITIGADGSLYCHDLTPDIESALCALAVSDTVTTAGEPQSVLPRGANS